MDLYASEVPTAPPGSNAGRCQAYPMTPKVGSSQAAWEANQTYAEYPRDHCLHELIQETAQRKSESIAVVCEAKSLTYGELDAQSNQLAHYLQRQGVGAESLVGLCVNRSIEMVVALLGILKAGGAYVPLDPAYPTDRIKYVLDDARVKILAHAAGVACLAAANLGQGRLPRCRLAGYSGTRIADRATSEVKPGNLAYVIYTSGSTGRPKGVQLEHRSVVNFLSSMQRQPGMAANDVLVAVTTLSFDIAGLELYLPLLAGCAPGRCIARGDDGRADADAADANERSDHHAGHSYHVARAAGIGMGR